MRHLLTRGVTLTLFGAWGALSLPAQALEIGAGYIQRLTNPDAYYTFEPWCCGLPMIQPGNKALIDDYWIDASIWPISYPVAGDYLGTKATAPSGSVQSNYVT